MKTVAETLREARVAKGRTVQEVSDEIKIRASYLKALEENDYDKFLSETQLKGFLTNYANHLNIDTHKILALYRRERIAKEEEHSPKYITDKKVFVFTPKFLIGPVVGMLALLVIGFFVYQYYQTAKPPQLDIQKPRDGFTTESNKVVVGGIAEVGSTIRVNSKEVAPIDNNGRFETTVELTQNGNNTIYVEAENGFKKKTTKTINIFYSPIEVTPTPTPTPSITPTVTPSVTITTTPTIRVSLSIRSIATKALPYRVIVDDGTEQSKQLKAQEEIKFEALKKVAISGLTSKDVNIVLNGVAITLDPTKSSFTFMWDEQNKVIKQL